jgi:hypothetical protein
MGGTFLARGFLARGSWRRTQPLHRPLRRYRRDADGRRDNPKAVARDHPGHHPAMTARRVICWPREPPCRHPGPRPVSPAVPFSRDYSAATDGGAAGTEIERAVCILANHRLMGGRVFRVAGTSNAWAGLPARPMAPGSRAAKVALAEPASVSTVHKEGRHKVRRKNARPDCPSRAKIRQCQK